MSCCADTANPSIFLQHIKTVAKYAARLGQRFSSTTPVGVQDLVVENIPDVERNGFCFSDGIGCISTSFAKRVSETLQLDKVPSAFQVHGEIW